MAKLYPAMQPTDVCRPGRSKNIRQTQGEGISEGGGPKDVREGTTSQPVSPEHAFPRIPQAPHDSPSYSYEPVPTPAPLSNRKRTDPDSPELLFQDDEVSEPQEATNRFWYILITA